MAHAHHQFDRAVLRRAFENFIDQWNQRGDAFERKPLGAQISLLQDQLKKIGADQKVERAFLIDLGLRAFQPLLNPAAALGIGDVRELCADGSAIYAAGFLRELAVDLQIGLRSGCRKSQRIEVGFEISPLAESVKNAFALAVGCVHECGAGRLAWASGRHRSAYRIKDVQGDVLGSEVT